jgi:cytoskeletal protein RodZ
VNLDAAQDYMYQLEQAGALCELVEMKSKSKKEPKKEPTPTAPTAITDKTPETTAVEKEINIEKPVKEQTQSELRYQLLFKGETLHGKDINEVKTNLSMFYKVKPDKLAGLFAGKPVAVTPEPTDFWTAVAYLNRFHECGAISYLETVESPETVGEKPDKYKIVFWGELQKGHDLLTLKTNLASMFKVSGVVIDKLFPGKPVLVKTDLDQDAAKEFKKNFETTGARCQVLKLSENPQLPARGIPARETETPAAPRQVTYQPPRQLRKTGKKMNVLTLLVIAVAILAVFIIFKAISGKSTGKPETTPSTQTTAPPSATTSSPQAQPSPPQPQPQSKTPSGSRLQAEPTKAFADPLKYYSVSLPGGYIYINESKGKQSKFLFNYSANINVTITASPLTEKRDHQETMYAKVSEIESGNAGPLSRLSISSYDLVSFSGLEGFEIILERGTQLVHMYEMVSPNNTAFSIIIVTIGDNNQENHDILDTALRESLRF